MLNLPGALGTFTDFLIIAFGFGCIIFVHELGHFVAAKWAGIRVLAFSIGFGNVLCSYRKGIGFVRGSSDSKYREYLKAKENGESGPEISPTEYRLSMLPLGGYVKMLGQEDLNPEAVSAEPDSYQNCPAPKRIVVISAGVIMNLITAALLFILVFQVGREVFPSRVGFIVPDSPASSAIALSHSDLEPGLQRGDTIIEINGKQMYSFEHILPEIAMSSKSQPSRLIVEREGVEGRIEFETQPVKSSRTGLLDIGINPAFSTTLVSINDPQGQQEWDTYHRLYGLSGFEPGDQILDANGFAIGSPFDLLELAQDSVDGTPIDIRVQRGDQIVNQSMTPIRAMINGRYESVDTMGKTSAYSLLNTLGLSGVMMVNPYSEIVNDQVLLEPGDIFARIGSLEYPTYPEGVRFINAQAGNTIEVVVLRKNAQDDSYDRVKIEARVDLNGRIGFLPSMSTSMTNLLSSPLEYVVDDPDSEETGSEPTRASELGIVPGSRLISIGDYEIKTLRDVSLAIINDTQEAFDSGAQQFSIELTMQLPIQVQSDGTIPMSTVQWELNREDIESLRELGWTIEGGTGMLGLFEMETFLDRSSGPIDSIKRGIGESRRVMLQTYITFLRLFQGSVGVEHLKGPVGIAHLGTQIASQGWVWVLFFMALISINLAVINFLPLPIVDGGQFLMLIYEWIRGKPVPILFQNITTLGGLLLIGTMFLYVTFNDIKVLFGV